MCTVDPITRQRVPNNVHIPPDIYEKYNRTPVGFRMYNLGFGVRDFPV